MSRFAIRQAVPADAEGIARAHTESWQSSYRGILPDTVLERLDVTLRADTRRRILLDPAVFQLVAYDATHGDVVGFCDAGPSRRGVAQAGELYAIYLMHYAKRYGLGTELFERVTLWLKASGMPSMIVWVLEHNQHAHRFYEAMGGRRSGSVRSSVQGFSVVELSYIWDQL